MIDPIRLKVGLLAKGSIGITVRAHLKSGRGNLSRDDPAMPDGLPPILTQDGKNLKSIQLTMLIRMEPRRAPQKPLT